MAVNLVFLVDTSLSMKQSGRDHMVNEAMPRVLFRMSKRITELGIEASVRVISFNDIPSYMIGSKEKGVDLLTALKTWKDIEPRGSTRTGLAIKEATKVMSNRYLLSGSGGAIYVPIIILFTDGCCSNLWKDEYHNAIDELKKSRVTKNGHEAILRIALGVDAAEENGLAEFASKWKTVTGYNDDGGEIVEDDKLQVYMTKDVDHIADVLSNLSVSSIQASSTADQEQNAVPLRLIYEQQDEYDLDDLI